MNKYPVRYICFSAPRHCSMSRDINLSIKLNFAISVSRDALLEKSEELEIPSFGFLPRMFFILFYYQHKILTQKYMKYIQPTLKLYTFQSQLLDKHYGTHRKWRMEINQREKSATNAKRLRKGMQNTNKVLTQPRHRFPCDWLM